MAKELRVPVTGMSCAACVGHVERAAKTLPSVESAEASLLTYTLTLRFTEDLPEREIEALRRRLEKALKSGGYGIAETDEGKRAAREEQEKKREKTRLILSVAFTLLLMYVSMGHMVGLPLPPFLDAEVTLGNGVWFAVLQMVLTLPVAVLNRKFFTVGFGSLFRGKPNMDSLIAVGSLAVPIPPMLLISVTTRSPITSFSNVSSRKTAYPRLPQISILRLNPGYEQVEASITPKAPRSNSSIATTVSSTSMP